MSALISEPCGVIRVPVASVADIVTARLRGRVIAEEIGFSPGEATLVATVISELARNIVEYAHRGDVDIRPVDSGGRRGIIIVARDQGPGIRNIDLAVRPGYSTSGGLGLGLPGVRRIVDDFHIRSGDGNGTTVTIAKWKG